jgi:hypothetical protein
MAQGPGKLAGNATDEAYIALFESGSFKDASKTIKDAFDAVDIGKAMEGKGVLQVGVHGLSLSHGCQGRGLLRHWPGVRQPYLIAQYHDSLG